MLDDFRLEWLCRRTCEMLNIDRGIFLDMLERNNGFNEDLIDTFLNINTDLHERLYALIFHCEDSIREVWQIAEMIDEEELEEFDEENEQQIVLIVNEPIDPETEYPLDFVFNHARLSTGDTIDSLYEDWRNIEHLLVINQHDHKRYHFTLNTTQQARLHCEYQHYHDLTRKTFVYYIRMDSDQYLLQSSTYEEMSGIMNENLIYGIVPDEQPLISLGDSLRLVYKDILPQISKSKVDEVLQYDQLRVNFDRFDRQIESTLRQMQGELNLIVPKEYLVFHGDESEDEYIENLEYLVYNWESILQKEMNEELNRRMIKRRPLDELEFWHERSIRISSILEQMKKGWIHRMN